MKLFLVMEEFVGMVGIRPLRPNEKSSFNRRNVTVLLIFGLFFMSATAFLMFDAKTFRDYAEAFFPWSTLLIVCIGLLTNISKMTDVFALRAKTEQMIEAGERFKIKWMRFK